MNHDIWNTVAAVKNVLFLITIMARNDYFLSKKIKDGGIVAFPLSDRFGILIEIWKIFQKIWSLGGVYMGIKVDHCR